MNYKKARQHMQDLLREVTKHYDAHILPKIQDFEEEYENIGQFAASPEIEEKVKLDHHKLEMKVNQFGEELASYPEYFDVLTVWTVKIIGQGGVDGNNPQADYEEIIEVLERAGSLAGTVRAAVEEEEYDINGINVTKDFWEILVTCNEPESRRLCAFIHRRFRAAVQSGLLKVRKTYSNFRLPDVCDCGEEHD